MTENCGIRVKLAKVNMTVSEQTTNKGMKVVAWVLYSSEMKIVSCRFSFIYCLFQGSIGAPGEDGKTGRDGSNVIMLLRPCYCNHTSVFFVLTSQKLTDSSHMLTSLLPPNSDHVMIHLRGFNWVIFPMQLIAWEYVHTKQL